MRKILYALFLLVLTCCVQNGKFHVEGCIEDACDSMMYLEHITLGDGIVAVDSVKLKQDGAFAMEGLAEGNPEFYRLRIGGQCINLAFDSTETVSVKANIKNMSFGYEVNGSNTCDTIRMLSKKLAELEQDIRKMAENRDYTVQERDSFIREMIVNYKNDVKMNFIHNHYDATYSYFACFQMLGPNVIFNPINEKSDLTWLRAVANAWNDKYPDCPRTKNLFNIVNEGRKNQVKPKQIVLDLNDEKVRELGIIDITMPDIHGNESTLSNLKGKVVLLDFTAFSLQGSQERILEMRKLYDKFHDRGFEIYQIGLDPDRHFWAQHCEKLPWVSVYCEEGLNSDIVTLYQVQGLPTYFLIDRNCDLQARQENIRDIEKAIEALL